MGSKKKTGEKNNKDYVQKKYSYSGDDILAQVIDEVVSSIIDFGVKKIKEKGPVFIKKIKEESPIIINKIRERGPEIIQKLLNKKNKRAKTKEKKK